MAFALMDDDIENKFFCDHTPEFDVSASMMIDISEVMVKELEKVKEMIRNRKDGWGKYPCCDCCIDIIDAEISELKGETHVES